MTRYKYVGTAKQSELKLKAAMYSVNITRKYPGAAKWSELKLKAAIYNKGL